MNVLDTELGQDVKQLELEEQFLAGVLGGRVLRRWGWKPAFPPSHVNQWVLCLNPRLPASPHPSGKGLGESTELTPLSVAMLLSSFSGTICMTASSLPIGSLNCPSWEY